MSVFNRDMAIEQLRAALGVLATRVNIGTE